ncbi:hypothetical protein ONS95_001269 [Cadophora gregata]|uniref:uncharacterized protein n=1 Tax=Cadophora gregata TaxID=51156 RepID=UPI0026DBF24D|nr:uncharacterized protein ONS95_001269 [Cadophora gregata]KAK0129340.1 hypothetical protein ONS95_001269 [Cadophora gregata]
MLLPHTALLLVLTQHVLAQTGNARGSDFLRFGCSQLVVERTDPLVTPGQVPSPHMHQIVGGNAFNASVFLHLLFSPLFLPSYPPILPSSHTTPKYAQTH